MPLPDMMAAVLAMDESVLDVDQVKNLIKFCPTKEEMELLKGYTGDKENLEKCEQVLADRPPGLLDFHLDLVSLEAATKVMIYAWLEKENYSTTNC
ncbi:formin-like protein 21b isoform X1 [Arachis ipaensis]|uniref:formin-like protein 21b isoform X1 n=1 Tax=Arachis ipaensis TaxID=130454 RepID=UPI000A2B5488|nr:formin-like protein 21b isoform X1 [Arachis ipaensis]